MSMKNLFVLLTIFFTFVWSLAIFAQQAPISETDPNPGLPPFITDIPGDILATWDIEILTGETGNLGVHRGFGFLWVTSRGLLNPLGHVLWKFDISSGTPVKVDSFAQGTTSLWGWRDLCDDGTFLYASDSDSIVQIDPATGLPTGVSIPGPINPNRALAYDPATDHFWTASFTSDLYEFDRNGVIINQFPNPASMYGAAWDALSPGGPFLWINGDPGSTLSQVNPVTGALTGVAYSVSGGLDGGVDLSVNDPQFPGIISAFALVQETPDNVYVVEINVPIPVELTSFSATVQDGEVTLSWATATETNNQGFEIQRSSGDDFESIGYVPGHGTTTEIQSYNFVDADVLVGSYTYRLKQFDFDGSFEYSDPIEVDVPVPEVFSLAQNFPNPFNPSTKIKYNLSVDSKVSLSVFNLLGEEVALLVNSDNSAGNHTIDFDAAGLNSGVYFYRIDATGVDGTSFSSVKKMILAK